MDDIVYFYTKSHLTHTELGHPERPERVETLRSALQSAGFWDPYPKLAPHPLPVDFLAEVHRSEYLEVLRSACAFGERLDVDTYTTPDSWEIALQTAGGALAVALAVWEGHARRGFALTRPPGHHATSQQGMGFCLLNNVAISAEWLIRREGARRLAIVDLDLHHGNGTQEIFWKRPDVLYISTHQTPLYPGTGAVEEVGAGPGEGYTANIPLPPGSGDEAFRSVLQQIILPLLDRFRPELLLVSVGFDPHWRDPLGHLLLSAGAYGELIGQLTAWADGHCAGKIALILEGGYDLEAAAACGQAVTAALLGRPFLDPLGPAPHLEGRSWQANVRRAREIWGF